MKLEVSNKHLKLRITLFVILFIVIVVSFTNGILSIGRKQTGYQKITADVDENALTYNNWVSFNYYMEGSSNSIKAQIKELTKAYTQALSSAYKELDESNTYTERVSIAQINRSIGKTVSVSPELYFVLQDAYEHTLENRGFNMFAGALYSEWESILILTDPEEFDPLVNESQKDRIMMISQMVSDLSNFTLTFSDGKYVRLDVSERYRALCESLELDCPVIDLSVMKQAYSLAMICDSLKQMGYENGYLFTESGLGLCMREDAQLDLGLYTLENDQTVRYATLALEGVFSSASLHAFRYSGPYGYQIEDADGTVYRSIWFDPKTGFSSDVLMNISVISSDTDIVDAMYQALYMNTMKTEREVSSYAKTIENDYLVSYIPQQV